MYIIEWASLISAQVIYVNLCRGGGGELALLLPRTFTFIYTAIANCMFYYIVGNAITLCVHLYFSKRAMMPELICGLYTPGYTYIWRKIAYIWLHQYLYIYRVQYTIMPKTYIYFSRTHTVLKTVTRLGAHTCPTESTTQKKSHFRLRGFAGK